MYGVEVGGKPFFVLVEDQMVVKVMLVHEIKINEVLE